MKSYCKRSLIMLDIFKNINSIKKYLNISDEKWTDYGT